ncbi:hypothetical protein ATANTOWER_014695 [Ataeniobius toweri]|uniref:Uncharacterized protein n=1 Tax=Ataeniobius toweri TaxID=208326 RepID=A0ABU7AGL9_9TELE|nr:hypothetical protein [Ataeniobius toweri]
MRYTLTSKHGAVHYDQRSFVISTLFQQSYASGRSSFQTFRRHFFHSSPVAHADVTRFFVAGGGGEWIGLQRELSREVTDVTGINVHRV